MPQPYDSQRPPHPYPYPQQPPYGQQRQPRHSYDPQPLPPHGYAPNGHPYYAQFPADRMQAEAQRQDDRPWYTKLRFVIPGSFLVLIVLITSLSHGSGGTSSVTSSTAPVSAVQPAVTPPTQDDNAAAVQAQAAPAVQDPPPSQDVATAPQAFPGETRDDMVVNAGAAANQDGIVLVSSVIKPGDSVFDTRTLCTAVSYNNRSDKSTSFDGFDWKLQDPGGTILSMTFGGSDNLLESGDLAPGGNVSGDVCFDNKRAFGSGRYVVLYQSSFFSDVRVAWINNR